MFSSHNKFTVIWRPSLNLNILRSHCLLPYVRWFCNWIFRLYIGSFLCRYAGRQVYLSSGGYKSSVFVRSCIDNLVTVVVCLVWYKWDFSRTVCCAAPGVAGCVVSILGLGFGSNGLVGRIVLNSNQLIKQPNILANTNSGITTYLINKFILNWEEWTPLCFVLNV